MAGQEQGDQIVALCRGGQAAFEKITKGSLKKGKKLSPAFAFNFSEAPEHGASEAHTEIFQFFLH